MKTSKHALALAAVLIGAPLAAGAQTVVTEGSWSVTSVGVASTPWNLAEDAAGNVYLIAPSATDIVISKTTPSGAPSWTAAYVPPTGYTASYIDSGVTSDGTPFVVANLGALDPASPVLGMGVQRYDPATGAPLSLATFYPAGYGWFLRARAAAGKAGDIYLAGEADTGWYTNVALVHVDATGSADWTTLYSQSQYNWNVSLGVDSTGAAVIIHDAWLWNYLPSIGSWGMDPRLAVNRFDAGGTHLYGVIYEGIPGRERMGTHHTGIAFDGAGNTFVSGMMDTPSSSANALREFPYVAKFDPSGTLLWSDIDESKEQGWGWWGGTLVVDSTGAAFVAYSADSSPDGRGLDCAVNRYEPTGAWSQLVLVDGQESGDDTGCQLATDGRGALYLSATSQFAGRGPDATVLRLDPLTGATLWRAASGSTLLARPAISPQRLVANDGGSLAVYAPSATGDLGLLTFGPTPSPASLVAPVATPLAAASTKGSRNVLVSLTSTNPNVSCNVTGGGDVFDRLNLKAGSVGAFLYRPQVAPAGYDATCYYTGPAGAPAVTATLTLRLEQGANTVTVPLAFDATATPQAVSNVLDPALGSLTYALTSRLFVFDGVGSRDPDSGLLSSYRWDVTEATSGKAVTTLFGKGATFRFPASKPYNVKLTVTDDDARSSSATITVTP